MTRWFYDQNKNSASLARWGSEINARNSLNSLSCCFGCVDCIDCSNCSKCTSCSGCFDCHDCLNSTNCSRCFACEVCLDCYECDECFGCSNSFRSKDRWSEKIEHHVPIVENIHLEVFKAAEMVNALDMNIWHSCETTHCRAGWVVYLAGEIGREFEKKTNTCFAAMMIYKYSDSSHSVSPVRFHEATEKALVDMKRMAEVSVHEKINSFYKASSKDNDFLPNLPTLH